MTLLLPSKSSSNSKFELPSPPDLLRRFVALPHRGTWSVDGVTFEVATNREELLQSFPSHSGSAKLKPSVRLKVVVDPDISHMNDDSLLIMDLGQMRWGTVCGGLFVFDRGKGEAFIFVPEVCLRAFKPIFQELFSRIEPTY